MRIRLPWFLVFVLFLFAVKAFIFNSFIQSNQDFRLLAILTCCYFGFFNLMFKIWAPRRYMWLTLIMYILTSLVMLIDLIYLKYTTHFTSILLINHAFETLTTLERYRDFFNLRYLSLIIDLPVVVLLSCLAYEENRKITKVAYRKPLRAAATVAILGLLPLLVIINPLEHQGVADLRAEEFFSYHVYDLRHLIIKEKDVDINDKAENNNDSLRPESLVAHAGGQLQGYTYTNCLEALDYNYSQGFRFFELDIEWTLDNKPVALHTWTEDNLMKDLFHKPPEIYNYHEFMSFTMINNWHQLDMEGLAKWLHKHPDAYIITDVKRNNVALLQWIKDKHQDIQGQIIPQIFQMKEYESVTDLGYGNIIYTLYASENTDEEILDFARNHRLFAVTIPMELTAEKLTQHLIGLNIHIYTNTVNRIEVKKELEQLGIKGFYTDHLFIDHK